MINAKLPDGLWSWSEMYQDNELLFPQSDYGRVADNPGVGRSESKHHDNLATIPPDGTIGLGIAKRFISVPAQGRRHRWFLRRAATAVRRWDPAQTIPSSIPYSEHPSDRRCALHRHHWLE